MKNRLFEIAQGIAALSTHKFKHGALLVKGSNVIHFSINRNRPVRFANKFRKDNNGTLHAELGCILNLSKEVTKGCDIYVVRVLSSGKLAMSKPCDMCQAACHVMGIKRMFYTDNKGSRQCIKL